jgi:hypothetical protein
VEVEPAAVVADVGDVLAGRDDGEPHGRHGLAIAAELSSQGRFRVPVQEVFPAARAAEAHATAAQGARQGKIALTSLAGDYRDDGAEQGERAEDDGHGEPSDQVGSDGRRHEPVVPVAR